MQVEVISNDYISELDFLFFKVQFNLKILPLENDNFFLFLDEIH